MLPKDTGVIGDLDYQSTGEDAFASCLSNAASHDAAEVDSITNQTYNSCTMSQIDGTSSNKFLPAQMLCRGCVSKKGLLAIKRKALSGIRNNEDTEKRKNKNSVRNRIITPITPKRYRCKQRVRLSQ